MGNRSNRVSYDKWDINQLSRNTGLSPEQIQQIHQEFSRAAGRDGQLNMQEFTQLYNRFPGASQQDPRYMQQQIQRVFRTFDRDNSGALSFDEYLSAVVMMNHSVPRRDRIDFLVRQNNAQGCQRGNNGQISAQYGHQVLRRLNDYYGGRPGTEHQIWKQIDSRNRGYVSEEDFINFVSNQDVYNRRYQF